LQKNKNVGMSGNATKPNPKALANEQNNDKPNIYVNMESNSRFT